MISRLLRSVLVALAFVGSSGAHSETPGEIGYLTLPDAPPALRPFAATPRVRFGVPSDNKTVVALYYRKANGSIYICTGVLLTRQLVLTAGHCGCGLSGSYRVDLRQDARRNEPEQLLAVNGAPILYDQRVCDGGTIGDGNDLALIRLRDQITDAYRNDLNLDSHWEGFGYPPELVFEFRKQIVKGTLLTVVGYGYTESFSIGMRNQGQVPVYSFDCEEPTLSNVCSSFAEMILAGSAGTRPANDTCGGDSGGPVFWTYNGKSRLVAITSRAAPGLQENPSLHCGGGGIYTLIGRNTVHQWLEANGIAPIGSDAMMSIQFPKLDPTAERANKCVTKYDRNSPAFISCMANP